MVYASLSRDLQETCHFGVCDTVELPEESREEMLRHSDTSAADYRRAVYIMILLQLLLQLRVLMLLPVPLVLHYD